MINKMCKRREILFLTPVFKHMIWGGDKLKNQWKYDVEGENIGECWGISAHENGDRFPLLIKIIDAKADLSIQVHPDDEYARINENGSFGKTECWYILDATEDASLVIGHNARNKEELVDMIRNGKWSDFIRHVPVKKGDFIQIEPGTVHAIKGGIQILETQQNSDITYRVYDYDRFQDGKPRQLHIDKSIDVISVPAKPSSECFRDVSEVKKNCLNELISCRYYKVWKIDVDKSMSFVCDVPFMCMSIIEGEGQINDINIKKGDHFILPFGYGEVVLTGDMQIVASSLASED